MVSLSKNQTVSLSKQSTALSQLQFGLGWDPVKKKGLFGSIFGGNDSIDLDAGCVLLDAAGNKIDTIWFRKLKSSCGSVVHSGDNLTGEGMEMMKSFASISQNCRQMLNTSLYREQLSWAVLQRCR
jgi:tellurium resistance protein TerZ